MCSSNVPGLQCCSQSNEDALGMRLNDALNAPNAPAGGILGSELLLARSNMTALYSALTGKPCHQVIYALALVILKHDKVHVYHYHNFTDH